MGRLEQVATAIGGAADAVTDYYYDSLGRVASIRQQDNGGNSVADKRVDFTYDDAGQWATIIRYADLAATDLVATGTYGYDDTGRLTDLTYTKSGATLPDYDWVFDAASRITQYVNSIDGSVDYTNDNAGQLTGADYDYQTDETYVYDDNGNRVTANGDTYVTGDNNQLLSDDTYRYAYDDEGNRILKFIDTDSSGTLNTGDTDITEYDWDYRNRLTSVEHFATHANYGTGTSDQIVTYVYDYQNRLIGRTLDPDGTSGANNIEQTVYIHDSYQITHQFDKTGSGDLAAGDLSHRYLWNPQAVDQILADETVDDGGAEDVLWALTDHLNTVRDLVSYNPGTDTTTPEGHITYDAYGNVTNTPAVDILFGYTGRLFDEDTGLQNNLNRWYDVKVGRWLSEDPIGFRAGDLNIYRYCSNNPANAADPTGLINRREWPSWLPIDTSIETIEKMMKGSSGKKLQELRKAKKILQEAKRLAGKAKCIRTRGGRSARCISPFDPLSIILDIFCTGREADKKGIPFGEQADQDARECPYFWPGIPNPYCRGIHYPYDNREIIVF